MNRKRIGERKKSGEKGRKKLKKRRRKKKKKVRKKRITCWDVTCVFCMLRKRRK